MNAMKKLHSGRYAVPEVLGDGPTSSVFAAYDTILERLVAIKVLRREGGVTAGNLAREARVLAAVQHPNVVAVHALHDTDEPPFLVMEWIDGRSLHVVLGEARPSVEAALAYLRPIAAGLDAIHAAGLVHGDIEPSNVIVGLDGRVRIVGVGLVPPLERTEPGALRGAAYVPPERSRGAITTRELAPRGDVYSFGVLAFELLTGRLPHVEEPRGGSGPIGVPLARVFEEPLGRAMSSVPSRRPASAGRVLEALERAAEALGPDGLALRVLVVDGDEHTRSLVSAALVAHTRGVSVEGASNGEAALESIRRLPPSVAVLDLSMPGLAGVELLRAILAVAPSLPIIVCAGEGSARDGPALRALGVRTLLVKPVDVDDLSRAIREAIDPPARRGPT